MEKRDLYNGDNEFVPFDFGTGEEGAGKKESSLEERVNGKADSEKTKDAERASVLESILSEKANYLKEILAEIESQIADREKLQEKIGSKIDSEICYLRTKLYELDSWGMGGNRDIDTRRLQLEKEIEKLKDQQRVESRESWRDISLLRKEHREFFREFRNAMKRVNLIFPNKGKPGE